MTGGNIGVAVAVLARVPCALLLVSLVASVMDPVRAAEPVSVSGPQPSIVLTRLGTYRSGNFSDSVVEGPPAYDWERKRLYFPLKTKQRIDVLDITNPSEPVRDFKIDLDFLAEPLDGIAYNGKILAAAFKGNGKSATGIVALLDRDGKLKGLPIPIGPQPSAIRFTGDRRKLLVVGRGEASGDYSEDPEGTLTIIDTCNRGVCKTAKVDIIDFRRFNSRRQELISLGVRLYGPNASVAQDLEPESIAVAPDDRTAWITLARNNALAVIDIKKDRATQIIPFGYKDHAQPEAGLDASDRDGRINIVSWPLKSWYQPDAIEAYASGEGVYLVTANEGDPRDFESYTEVTTVAELRLDRTAFPQAAALQRPENLGRLQVTNADGDTDGDGDHDALYAFGGRSMSIWSASGHLIFDSGDAFERITAQAVPAFFNASDTNNRLDDRSPSRGPEPEPLAVGSLGARTYAFVGFERLGGVMVYDITNPAHPTFEQYINNRNFAIDPASCIGVENASPACADIGDLSVEGVLLIAASQSPIGVPLLVLTHETTESLTLYRIDPAR